jgi:hypothetical protein
MRGLVGRKLEMAARVRVFSRAHPSEDPGYATILGRFEERLSLAEAIAAKQHDGLFSAKGARGRRAELRKVVHFQLLRSLVTIGGIAARTRSEPAERFKLPDSHATNRGFLTSVKSMLAMADAQKESLVSEGMSPTLLEQLGTMLTAFEAASESARASRLDHIGARADLEEVTVELTEMVNALDGINRWRFGSTPELLVEWNAAKHVRSAGTVPAKVSPRGPEGPVAGGASPGAIAPAA